MRGLALRDDDEPGFWESNGYHMRRRPVAGAALLGRLTWLVSEVVETAPETPRARTLVLDAEGWESHRAGQHVDVRLTAEDGYQAERSYSIASAPGQPLALTIERLEDGEVSPYLVDVAREGDRFELRGPIGGYFVWDGGGDGPLLLVGGGSGVVPLMSMIRHRAATGDERRFGSSTRRGRTRTSSTATSSTSSLRGTTASRSSTRSRGAQPEGWTGFARRIDAEILQEVAWPAADEPRVFVCGSTALRGHGRGRARRARLRAGRIRTERFGATG